MPQRTIPLPRRSFPWTIVLIVVMGVITLAAIAFAAGTLLNSGASSAPPSVSVAPRDQAANAVAPLPVVIVTSAPASTPTPPTFGAAPIPGNGITLGIYAKPGKPGEMTDGGQIAASFILLASSGRIEEALKLAGPSPSLVIVRQANLLRERYPDGFKEGIQITFARGQAQTSTLSPTQRSVTYADVRDVASGNSLLLGKTRSTTPITERGFLLQASVDRWLIFFPEELASQTN